MLTTIAKETVSFKLTAPGIEALDNGRLKVGDLILRDLGDGKQLWKILAIVDGTCFLEVPTIWDEIFADVIGWEG
jgi:hypothetical protein